MSEFEGEVERAMRLYVSFVWRSEERGNGRREGGVN